MYQFKPSKIYYEKEILNYDLGKSLFEKYNNIEKIEIKNHNNIEELRQSDNKDFPKLKRNLIIGVRKVLKYVPNNKISNYLVPYTSSGCVAMCMYCYLVCNYNKCAYLRLFVNREQMLDKLIKMSKLSEKDLVFEIGSNSDLILENTITQNLEWTIERFSRINKGYITFPTKFDMVDSLLNLNHNRRVIIRMSVNPEYIINNVEFGTSKLSDRIKAINKLADVGYIVGIIIAPIIMVENWKPMYKDLIEILYNSLSENVKKQVFFECIFMTYGYVLNAINKEAFPNAIEIYSKDNMRGAGRNKYYYRKEILEDGKKFILEILKKYFPNNDIKYIV